MNITDITKQIRAFADELEEQNKSVFATPPYEATLHNPDKLTAEQVGVGYRLVVKNDSCDQPHDLWSCEKREWVQGAQMCCTFEDSGHTYRLPLSVPWPPVPADPYAELKAAHAAGKVIQVTNNEGDWKDIYYPPLWNLTVGHYRIKPAAPPFQLPPPPPGMQWHREDGWKDGMLEKGKRPLVKGETYQKGDLYGTASNWEVVDGLAGDSVDNWPNDDFSKTTRPLVFEHEGKSWTYHRPGDPRPCEDRRIYILCKDGIDRENHVSPNDCRWSEENTADIIGWRYAEPLAREVELGPEDVPPTTVLRGAGEVGSKGWCLITSCSEVGIRIWRQSEASGREITWQRLRESESQINRPRHRDADGNPTLWEKCSKEVPA